MYQSSASNFMAELSSKSQTIKPITNGKQTFKVKSDLMQFSMNLYTIIMIHGHSVYVTISTLSIHWVVMFTN